MVLSRKAVSPLLADFGYSGSASRIIISSGYTILSLIFYFFLANLDNNSKY